jgi:TRAP-type mannitol/chloroaromatic compound transport system substrate-binding protein
LQQLKEDPNIEIRPFPPEVIKLLRSITREVVDELMAADPAAARIGKAYFAYLDIVAAQGRLSEQAYLNTREY